MEYSVLEQILEAIDEEIARLEEARTILGGSQVTRPSRPALAGSPRAVGAPRRRSLSTKARQAIGQAQRRRWANVKSQQTATSASATEEKAAAAS
jgi:hypothetical protein